MGMLEDIGLTQGIGDEGCYVKGDQTIIGTHVDDLLRIAATEKELNHIERRIEATMELEKIGKPSKMLGMELT